MADEPIDPSALGAFTIDTDRSERAVYRCTKGHVFERQIPKGGSYSDFLITLATGERHNCCLICLTELLGHVERIE